MAEAVSDMVVKPYQGVREDGAKGAVKGIGKGMVNMTSKAGCAMFGVLVYHGAGVAKSLKPAEYSRTKQWIVKARHVGGTWFLEDGGLAVMNSDIAIFKSMLKGKNT
jgi:hypothetical protein